MSDIAVAALLAGIVLLASTISVEIGLSVALIELLGGVIAGNAFHVDVPGWLGFLGSFAGILLTFQAGAEVDVVQLRREPATGRDRWARALDDEPRRRVRGARGDGSQPGARREAVDVRDVRHRHRDG